MSERKNQNKTKQLLELLLKQEISTHHAVGRGQKIIEMVTCERLC